LRRWWGLKTKLALAFTLVSIVGVAVAAIFISQNTTRQFTTYLSHAEMMRQMMGMMGGGVTITVGSPEEGFIRSVNRSLWIAGGIGVAVALILSLLLARQVVNPLSRLTKAARRIAQGDISQRVPVSSRDEIGELAQAFNTMAEALERNERLRRQMLADITHELRTPLSVIQGELEGMMDGVVPLDRGQVAAVHKEVALLGRLISDLRDLSLVEAGQLRLERTWVDVADLLRRRVEGFQPQAQAKGLSLTLSVADGLPQLYLDADRVSQVLANLLTNALRYTPEGGTVEVKASLVEGGPLRSGRGPALAISVSDTGPGIPPEDLPHIFERFYRADPSRTRATGGSGLGLAIARGIVEAHGGHIWVESQPGRGATFTFTLPLGEVGPR
jgi:signal transduction histidine kinase